MSLYPPRCPKCGSQHLDIDDATPAQAGLDAGEHSDDGTATCMVCGWTGWASEADA